jgi:hypothetical protein
MHVNEDQHMSWHGPVDRLHADIISAEYAWMHDIYSMSTSNLSFFVMHGLKHQQEQADLYVMNLTKHAATSSNDCAIDTAPM